MSEQVLTVLKFCLLALIYLFLARVVWVVTRELAARRSPHGSRPRRRQRARRGRRGGW